MPWEEISPGRFERSLDPSEAFFHSLRTLPCPPGRERWALTCVTKFESSQPAETILPTIKQAWKQLRYQFPVLAARLEQDKKVYEVPTDEGVEVWLNETVIVEPGDADPEQIIATYKSVDHASLHYLPGSLQILLRINHWRTDAVGLCILTNSFFKMLANPKTVTFGDEGKKLSPSIEEVADICQITEEKKKILREKQEQNLQSGRSVGVRIQGVGRPQGTNRKTHILSEKTTAAIIAACKARSVTVTTAATAALGLAIRKHEDVDSGSPAERLCFSTYFNLRPYMPWPFDSAEHPLSMMVVGDTINIELTGFEESLKRITPFYAKDLSLESGTDLIPLVGTWYQSLIDAITAPPQPAGGTVGGTQAPTLTITPSLNSIGILDRYIDSQHNGQHQVKIEDYWFTVDVLGPMILCYVWTFQSKMRVTCFYNETSFTGEFVQMLTESFIDTLLECLDLGSEFSH